LDIKTIYALEEGLKTLSTLKDEIFAKKLSFSKQQRQHFSQLGLSAQDMIKKNFLQMTSLQVDKISRHEASEKIRDALKQQTTQLPPLSSYQKDISGNFSGIDLSGLYFNHSNLLNPYHLPLDLRSANLSHCIFFGDATPQNALQANLSSANLEAAEFLNLPSQGISIEGTNFSHANLKQVNFTGVSNWSGVNLTQANLINAYLYNKDGIKITGEELKIFLQGQPNVIGIDQALFEEQDLKQSPKNKMTFTEFKTLHGQESCLSKMRWGIYFGIFKTMEDVERYAKDNPHSRTQQILTANKSLRKR
jgi:uncharacterized protein YjbI with pentapeptide repeats